ncbi:MAG: hypothetical protein ACD_2C00207G0001 [uncultured bacterium (gcode 4)]|uniref:Uncharacterized protein n=1 Tax=uncultured bacterium (gcode 4) TaxID=1234023 RepID=K2H0C2_9BACT|nr:MAG: hypothetical protein ACD_2C00207G0001 [uncultured bacterium (gcode 4)]
MILQEHIIWALSSIITNKLRSALSMLWIIIGVSSIIILMALWQWTTKTVVDRFNSLWANLVTISAWSSNAWRVWWATSAVSSESFMDAQLVDYVKNIVWVKDVAPSAAASKQLIYNTYNTRANIAWVGPSYQTIKNLTIANGNFITDQDVVDWNRVLVLGHQVAQDAFWSDDPIGKEVKLEKSIYVVVWVLSDNSASNRRVYAPMTTVMSKVLWTHFYSTMDIEVDDPNNIEFMKTFIESELNAYLKITDTTKEPYTINSLSEILSSVQQVTWALTLFLAWIAAISLIVWWIWVMNIMLVSVTERTREIGIRKALWAMKSDILTQFLIEALFISIIAWLIWIWLSYLVVFLLNKYITAVISVNSIIMAFGSVVLIWIVFWILPASKASNLKPIDALRFE